MEEGNTEAKIKVKLKSLVRLTLVPRTRLILEPNTYRRHQNNFLHQKRQRI